MAARKLAPSKLEVVNEGSTVDRILEAAYQCFATYGIRKTTMEDIAAISGASRPTVYRYFSSKDHILRHICGLEIQKVNDELRRRITRADTFVDLLTECLLLTTRIAHQNEYVRLMIQSPDITSKGADPNSPDYEMIRSVWHNLLVQGARKGELADDLSEDEIASWLVLSESTLLFKVDSVTYTDAQLRAFIRRFIISPVVSSSDLGSRRRARKTPRATKAVKP
jgi:AcrR family transcriptional regulator